MVKMKHIFPTALLFILCFDATGQKQGNIWYFGEGLGFDFNNGSPQLLYHGGRIKGYPQSSNEFKYAEGSATISDQTGQLLFYSNGENIWDRNHQIMPNGAGLMGMYSSTHSAFIVPLPQTDSLFYVFTTDGIERQLSGGLRYSLVNMCLNNGYGDVVNGQKNVLLLDTVSEKLAGVAHKNGTDVWLLSHKFNSDAFYAYRVSPSGIVDTVISNVGSVHMGSGFFSSIGQMKPSPDGKRIALVFSNVTPAVAELFNFDDSTGVVSNPISLTTSNGEYGIEFSPDNSKLYTTSIAGLSQYNLSAGGGTQTAINASKTVINSAGCGVSGLQLGPDGRIYVCRCASHVGVVHNPNGLGNACNYADSAIDFGFPFKATSSFPSFINGYQYNNGISECLTVSSTEERSVQNQPRLAPNPITGQDYVLVDCNKPGQLTLFDATGRIQRTKELDGTKRKLNVSKLPSGVYFWKITTTPKHHYSGKLIKFGN